MFNRMKNIVICTVVLAIILTSFTFLEFFVFHLLGLQYESIGALIVFFILYVVLQTPLLVLVGAIPKALKSVGFLKSSNGMFTFILYFAATFSFILILDAIMDSIQISWQSIAIFSLLSAFVNLKMIENDDEPPSINSDAFQQLNDKFE